jgi:hypothetical protein
MSCFWLKLKRIVLSSARQSTLAVSRGIENAPPMNGVLQDWGQSANTSRHHGVASLARYAICLGLIGAD